LSQLKGSGEILNAFGYERDGQMRLFCTVVATSPNNQGLQLRVETGKGLLVEYNAVKGDFAAWQLHDLHDRLSQKHRQTLWVRATTVKEAGAEYIRYDSALYTAQPSTLGFDQLLTNGQISVDHTIQRTNGRVKDQGYLFKVMMADFETLFSTKLDYMF
jgi:hypothetical protein